MLNNSKFYLVKFNRKSGKILLTMEHVTSAMLALWAMENTRPTQDCAIIDGDNGNVVVYVEGSKSYPKVDRNPKCPYEPSRQMLADDLARGLLEALRG